MPLSAYKNPPHPHHSSHTTLSSQVDIFQCILDHLLICFSRFSSKVFRSIMASLMSLRLDGNQYQKRKRGGGGGAYHALGFLCVMLFIQKSCATQFFVGGKGNWGAPADNSTINYSQWAESKRFQIGDSLVFNYQSGQDSVLQVTREAYTNCSTTDTPMANFTDGHTVFTFNRSGAFYFISGNEDNCKNNEKLVVVVLADRRQHNSTLTSIAPSPAPAGEDSPPSGTVEINPTPAPESPPNAASYTSISLAGSIIGAVFAASSLVLAF